jgi:hypothetical protein
MADDANDPTADDVVDTDEDAVDAADGATEAADPEQSDDPVDTADDADGAADDDAADEVEAPPASEAKKKADAVIAERRAKDPTVGERKVERRVVTSRRVTPKAGAKPAAAAKDAAPAAASKARDAKKTEQILARTPAQAQAQQALAKGPSPWWVPAIMFGLIIIGGLVIMLNYMGVFGDPENIRLVIGLGFILGGIIAATQYR